MADKQYLQQAIQAAKEKLPDGHEVIVISVSANTPNPRVFYTASMERESAVLVLKTLLFQWGEKENWMEHID